jgi:DNA-binding winged helix-turn-helix (wHTH) protein
MSSSPPLYFASYRLDSRAQILWKGGHPVHLTLKAFAVLDYLARHADRLVTKHELLDHVWADVHVGDAVLKVAIREIRQALGDDPGAPRFVQTARRVGYRFVAPVSSADPSPPHPVDHERQTGNPPVVARAIRPVVGREQALRALTSSLSRAMAASRQVTFVVGEAGIGKTSVVDTFLLQAERETGAWVARGQCLEHAGGAEAYLPVLDALGALARLPGHERLITVLRRFAPTWLAQLPALVEEREALQREIFGATPDRMLREIAEALEALTADTPLVLFLDDLHWSDDATLDFVGLMARRSQASRLLLIAAYRPVDVVLNRPALKTMKQELAAKGLCEEIPLDFLTSNDAAAFLEAGFPGHAFPPGLASLIHQRTDGNPLFMTNLLDYLAAQGLIGRIGQRWELTGSLETVATASPETLHRTIEAQLARLPPEEHGALEAASTCGIDFSAVAVAAGLGTTEEAAEACLDRLAHRGQFVRSLGLVELPAHAWSARYQFVHSLHQEVLYRSLPPARRLRLHLRIAERIEQIYGAQAGKVASELAEHFEQARDYDRGIVYLRMAAANETRRFANREAAGWLERALELAGKPTADASGDARVAVLNDLGRVRRSMGDMRASSQAFLAAARTARERGDIAATVEALLLAASALTWFDGAACLDAADEAERLAGGISPTLTLYARGYSAYWHLLWERWRDDEARDCEKALALAHETQDPVRLFSMLPRCSYVRLVQGRYADAATAAAEGGDRALATDDAFGRMVCQFYRAWAELLAGWWGRADALLTESLELAERNGHRSWQILFVALRAWLLREAGAPQAARAHAEQAVDDARAVGVPLGDLVAQTQLGLSMLDDASDEAGVPGTNEGLEVLEHLRDRLAREPMLMGSAWRMPVHVGLSLAYRRRRDWADAELEARRACDLAATSGERTWLALGWTAHAEVALAQEAYDRAGDALDCAIAALADGDAPVAAWRVHACAARVAAVLGQPQRALEHQTRAASVIRRLAESMAATSDLRRTFLNSQDVQAALASASPAV